MINEQMTNALNKQINEELYSAYLYLAMSSYFENKDLKGFANWMRIQTQEELAHAMKLYNYLSSRGAKVKYDKINAPEGTWSSPLEIFDATLTHERHITDCINKLVDISLELRDHATNSFLQWYINEQVEEEATAEEVIGKLKIAGNDGNALLMLDNEFGQRIFVNPLGAE